MTKLQVITVARRMAGQIRITHPFEKKKEEWTQYIELLEHFSLQMITLMQENRSPSYSQL